MARFLVELSCHYFSEIEVEADSESRAVEYAMDMADDEIRDEQLDWDVEYVEELTDGEPDE